MKMNAKKCLLLGIAMLFLMLIPACGNNESTHYSNGKSDEENSDIILNDDTSFGENDALEEKSEDMSQVAFADLEQGMTLSLEQIMQASKGWEYFSLFAIKSGDVYTLLCGVEDEHNSFPEHTRAYEDSEWDFYFNAGDIITLSGDDELVFFSDTQTFSPKYYLSVVDDLHKAVPVVLQRYDDGQALCSYNYSKQFFDSLFLEGTEITEMNFGHRIEEINGVKVPELELQCIDEQTAGGVSNIEDGLYFCPTEDDKVTIGVMDGTIYSTGVYETAFFCAVSKKQFEGELGEPTRDGYYQIGTSEDLKTFLGGDAESYTLSLGIGKGALLIVK